jgi:peptide deformylase
MELVLYPNDILKEKATISVTRVDYPMTKLAEDMTHIMLNNNGIGLAANQVGRLERVVVMKEGSRIIKLFNPVILMKSAVKENNKETCLSFPGKNIKVKRAVQVKVRYLDEFSKLRVETFIGLSARVIQHEIDHLNGITLEDYDEKN